MPFIMMFFHIFAVFAANNRFYIERWCFIYITFIHDAFFIWIIIRPKVYYDCFFFKCICINRSRTNTSLQITLSILTAI